MPEQIWAVTRDAVVLDNPVKIFLPEEEVAEMVADIEKHYPKLGWVYFFADEAVIRG